MSCDSVDAKGKKELGWIREYLIRSKRGIQPRRDEGRRVRPISASRDKSVLEMDRFFSSELRKSAAFRSMSLHDQHSPTKRPLNPHEAPRRIPRHCRTTSLDAIFVNSTAVKSMARSFAN